MANAARDLAGRDVQYWTQVVVREPEQRVALRVLEALRNALASLEADKLLRSSEADEIWRLAQVEVGREAHSEVQLRGTLERYRSCQGEWLMFLEGPELEITAPEGPVRRQTCKRLRFQACE
mmetsp:Transcript_6122/g.17131  ORF Transcript_6122/g.17131 Transcript_6122/m.17131 type:complete len:122 (-) Transcript_6122:91-456(-)